MANDGTVKIGVELEEKKFQDGLSKLSKTAKSALGNLKVDNGLSGVFEGATRKLDVFKGGLSALGSVAKSAFSGISSAAKSAFSGIATVVKGALSTAADAAKKSIAAATAAVSAGTVAIGKLAQVSIKAYSNYEQLVGGVETLFKESSKTVMEYANNAYKTAGLSANEYMDTVTSFSASLLQGLGGDTEAAAQIADKAIVDMADNANKMGTDMASIQYAYQGFAKQNYTMLDNLKLGYGGTQAEMARLINDSGVLGSTMKVTAQTVNQVSFDKIIEAIHVVQERMGIAGTTAKEASETIQGSVNAMKAAWENFVTGMADENQDIGQLTENLVDSVLTVMNNIVPRIQTLLPRLIEGLAQLVANLLPEIPPILESILPTLIDGASMLVKSVVNTLPEIIKTALGSLPDILYVGVQIIAAIGNGIIESIPLLLDAVNQAIEYLADALVGSLPSFIEQIPGLMHSIADAIVGAANTLTEAGPEIIKYLARGISKGILALQSDLPQIIDAITDFITANLPALINGGMLIIKSIAVGILNNLQQIGQAAVQIISTFAQGLSDILPELIPIIVDIILEIIDVLTDPQNLSMLIDAALQIITAIADGLSKAMPKLIEKIPEIVKSIAEALIAAMPIILAAVAEIAKAIIDGIGNSIKAGFSGIFSAFGGNSGGTSSDGASRPRARMAAPLNETDTNGEEGYSLTASTFSRASAVRALASAIPNAESRVAVAAAAMTPTAAYSAPPAFSGGGGNTGGQQAPIILRPNWTIQFQGDTAQLGRVLNPIIKDEDRRTGTGV